MEEQNRSVAEGAQAVDCNAVYNATGVAQPMDFSVAQDSQLKDVNTVPDGNAYVNREAATLEQSGADNNVYGSSDPSSNVETSAVDAATAGYDANSYAGEHAVMTEQGSVPTDYASADGVQYATSEQTADMNGNGENKEQGQPAYEANPEEERLWSIVRANSADFNAWTALIQETEKSPEEHLIPKVRKVYDAFLAEFPLCYGYWKKYADHEARYGTPEKIVEVYERAVQAVTYSVDIWVHYVTFAMSTYEDPDTIRRLFERGLSYVGTDYLSFPLWDKYIEYEYSIQDWRRVADIYTRILQIPIQQLDRYLASFKQLATSRPLAELRSAEENSAVTATVPADVPGSEVSADETEAPKTEVPSVPEDDELAKYVASREEMYKKSMEFDTKIRDFETAIRRPYFHVKPLDELQLLNWHRYLDFTEKQGDFDRLVKLYERCLIACANYSEYWIRYVECMEANASMELANNALMRATQIFVKRQPEIHLFAARFKEFTGDVDAARAEYQLLTTELAPGLLDATMKYANMEHRQGNSEAALLVFESAIATEKAKEQSQSLPLLYVLYCRFLEHAVHDVPKAREVLTGALEVLPWSRPLFEVAVLLETISPDTKRIEYLDSIVEKVLSPKTDGSYALGAADREDISSIFLEFLDLFGTGQVIKKAEARHRLHFLPHKSTGESRKRGAQDSLTSDKSKVQKGYTGASGAVSPAQTVYQNGQAQWGANYVQQQQAWQQPPQQQTPQAQPQQWAAGYGQQAGYPPYGSYPNYAAPQQPATTAQAQSYPPYAQGYQAPAFPQQTYAQPAPSYTAPQQPAAAAAAAPQYYPGYY